MNDPHIVGRAFYWQPGQPVVAKEFPYAAIGEGTVFARSPLAVPLSRVAEILALKRTAVNLHNIDYCARFKDPVPRHGSVSL